MGKLSFGATGLSYQVDKPVMNVGGAPICPRCNKRVYFNEERKHLGKSFHKACFTCAVCKKSLDSTNVNGHEDEIYCTPCHRRQFGIKGYGFAGGAAGLSTEKSARDMYRPRSSRLSSSGSMKATSGSATSTVPVKPTPIKATTNASETSSQVKTNGHVIERQSSINELGSKPNSTVFKAPLIDKDHPDCCPRCGKRVYFAEEVKALKRKWHRLCFKCAICNKTLETGRCEGHQGEVYCTSCYAKNFGPKGYGYASSMVAADPNPHFHVRKAVSARTSSVGSSSNASSPGIAPGRMSPSTMSHGGSHASSPGIGPGRMSPSSAVMAHGIAARMSPAPATQMQATAPSPMQNSPAYPGSPAEPLYEPVAMQTITPSREYQPKMTTISVNNNYSTEKLHTATPNGGYQATNDATPSPTAYEGVREVPREAVPDTFTYNGEEWTDEKILNELNQFQQVMM